MLIRKTILTLASLTIINAHADQIIVSAIGQDVSNCRVNHRCEIMGLHDIQINNDSDKEHSYKYIYMICTKKFGTRTDCKHIGNTITVPAKRVWNNHHYSVIDPWFGASGKFSYTVETQVVGFQTAMVENKYSVIVKD